MKICFSSVQKLFLSTDQWFWASDRTTTTNAMDSPNGHSWQRTPGASTRKASGCWRSASIRRIRRAVGLRNGLSCSTEPKILRTERCRRNRRTQSWPSWRKHTRIDSKCKQMDHEIDVKQKFSKFLVFLPIEFFKSKATKQPGYSYDLTFHLFCSCEEWERLCFATRNDFSENRTLRSSTETDMRIHWSEKSFLFSNVEVLQMNLKWGKTIITSCIIVFHIIK